MPIQKSIFDFEPVQTFLKVLGKDIEQYFGAEKGALVYLKPDGVWYAEALYQWLKGKKKDITISSMEDDGTDLEEGKVRDRKVLIVVNESFTGKAHKRSTEAMRARKGHLNIKAIKFAAYRDRPGTADFAVDQYSAEMIWRKGDIDALDLKIIKLLEQDGRSSLSSIAGKTNLSSVAVKNRVERLLGRKILKVQGALNMDRFYSFVAHLHIEADDEAIHNLIERLEKFQEVYQMVRMVGGVKLLVCILVQNLENVDEFIEREIRPVSRVKDIRVEIGELPVLPKTFALKI